MCSMKDERGLQHRCSNEDPTPYIIVTRQHCRCCLDTSSILCQKLVQAKHSQQESKLGGPWHTCGWKEPSGHLQSTWLHQISGKELEAGLAAWPDLQPWGLNVAAVGVRGGLGPTGSLDMKVADGWQMTSALGRFGGNPDLSKKGCHVKAERLNDVFMLPLTIIQYFLKTTSGCIFRLKKLFFQRCPP